METEKVIGYLKEVCAIPRASKDEKAISDYLMAFARERGLEARQDEKNNLMVKKPASFGCTAPPVILQGHLDMVYVKEADNFHKYKEGIRVLEDEKYLFADGTSLGADNGVALAYCMALMDSRNVRHPELQFIFTTEEEVGLAGAAALDISWLDGNRFINLDSEEEGVFYASCAGGLRGSMFWNLKREKLVEKVREQKIDEYVEVSVMITGLKGGHSGINIGMGYANAVQIAGRILYSLNQNTAYYIGNISVPGKANAIPARAEMTFYMSRQEAEKCCAMIQKMEALLQEEYEKTDTVSIVTVVRDISIPLAEIYPEELNKKIADAVMLIPNGVMDYSHTIDDLVETSMNIGYLEEEKDEDGRERLHLHLSIRSSVESKKYFIKEKLEIIAEQHCDEVYFQNDYPGWKYQEKSALRDTACKAYENLFGKKPKIAAIHAGLECGYWYHKRPGLDIISLGPNLYDVHTTKEKVSKKSIDHTWELLKEILKESC